MPARKNAPAAPEPDAAPAPAKKRPATRRRAAKVEATPASPAPVSQTPPAIAAEDPASPSATATDAGRAPRKDKPAKARSKPIRDSFTMPVADFGLLAVLKARALTARRAAKKSELLRAGLHALAALDAEDLVRALDALDPVPLGRPKQRR